MALLTLAELLVEQTVDQVRDDAYSILETLGFSVSTWRPGGVARTIVALVARLFAPWTSTIVTLARSGFLSTADGAGLTILAREDFNVDREEAAFATGFLTLTSGAFGPYTQASDTITFACSATGKTYRNTAPFTLPTSSSITIAIKATEIGSASSAPATGIDTLVTTLIGVTCSNATALVGVDQETDASLRQRCLDKLQALSPQGPTAIYDYVARTSSINGGVHVTRTQVLADSDHGDVTIYIADEDGALSGPDVALVQSAIDDLAAPICTEAIVASASAATIDVDVDVFLYTSKGLSDLEIKTRLDAALAAWFEITPVGGYILPPADGKLYRESIQDEAARAVPEAFRVVVTSPASAVDLGEGVVAVLGVITPTVTRIAG